MAIKIKTSKTLPKNHSGRKLKYPFDKMKVKNYLEFPAGTEKEVKKYYGIYAAARFYATRQQPEWKFASRIINGMGQIHRVE